MSMERGLRLMRNELIRPLTKEMIQDSIGRAQRDVEEHNATTNPDFIEQLDAYDAELRNIADLLKTANTPDDLMQLRRRVDAIVRALAILKPASYSMKGNEVIDHRLDTNTPSGPKPADAAKIVPHDRPTPRPEPKPVAPPVEPVKPAPLPEYAQHANEQGVRQRYEELLSKRTLLQQQLTSWKSIFKRGELRVQLDRVQQDLQRYEQKFPFVTQPRDFVNRDTVALERKYQTEQVVLSSQANRPDYLGDRQDAINKRVAVERAVSKQEAVVQPRAYARLVDPEDYRRSSERAFSNLKSLLANPPENWKSYQEWEIQAAAQEAYLSNFFALGSTEQHQVTDYWTKKIFLLEQVKPLLFGRAAWKKLYDHAYEQRRTSVHQGLQRKAA